MCVVEALSLSTIPRILLAYYAIKIINLGTHAAYNLSVV